MQISRLLRLHHFCVDWGRGKNITHSETRRQYFGERPQIDYPFWIKRMQRGKWSACIGQLGIGIVLDKEDSLGFGAGDQLLTTLKRQSTTRRIVKVRDRIKEPCVCRQRFSKRVGPKSFGVARDFSILGLEQGKCLQCALVR